MKTTLPLAASLAAALSLQAADLATIAAQDADRARADFAALTQARIAEIQSTPNAQPPTGAPVYYVSPDGDDARDGRTPQTAWRSVERISRATFTPGSFVLFARGGTWRASLDLPHYSNRPYLSYSGGLRCAHGVTYSAYGTGPKPRLLASPFNGADPARWRTTDATHVWACDLGRTDVGNVIFNEGEAWGIKIIPYPKNGVSVAQYTGRPFKDYRDLDRDLHFYHDWTTNGVGRGTGTLYLYSTNNPGTRFRSIEFGVRHNIITGHGKKDVTIDNLCLRYGGAHGIAGSAQNLRVQNCELGWIGGGVQGENLFGRACAVRYGNAVEVGDCNGYMVSNCWIHQVYDAGLTHQANAISRFNGKERIVSQKHIRYVANVIERCNYSIEYFINNCPPANPSTMDDYVIADNLMWYAGTGLSEQRPDRNQDAHVKSWAHSNRASGYIIRNNLFAYGHRQLIEVCSDLLTAAGTPSMPRLEGNVFLGAAPARFGTISQLPDRKTRPQYWNLVPAEVQPKLDALGNGNRLIVKP